MKAAFRVKVNHVLCYKSIRKYLLDGIKVFLFNFPVLVYLTGGIVGVAGQFRDWQFAAYGMYPLMSCFDDTRMIQFCTILFHLFDLLISSS